MNNDEENLEEDHNRNLLWIQMAIFPEISFTIHGLRNQEDKHLRYAEDYSMIN